MHMKATDLNRALNYVDDAYLMEADTPYKVIETESKEIKPMKTKKRAFRILNRSLSSRQMKKQK